MIRWLTFVTVFTMLLNFSSIGSAAEAGAGAKRSIATVLFSSLGGAIVGLSTLSFYSDAQNHTNNITIGSLLGFIGGVAYLTYNYEAHPEEGYSEFKLKHTIKNQSPVLMAYSFSF